MVFSVVCTVCCTRADYRLMSPVSFPFITLSSPASSTALDEQDVGDPIFFVVVSTSVGSVSLSLLEHQPQAGGKGEVDEETEAATVEEPVSISVPVHGLGTVSVSSVPVAPR